MEIQATISDGHGERGDEIPASYAPRTPSAAVIDEGRLDGCFRPDADEQGTLQQTRSGASFAVVGPRNTLPRVARFG